MHPKPVLVIALDAISAERLYDTLSTLEAAPSGSSSNDRSQKLVAKAPSPARSTARSLIGQSRFLIAHSDLFFWLSLHHRERDRFDLLYLRPALLILEDLFPASSKAQSYSTRFQRKLLIEINRYLSTSPTLNLETLFHEPNKAIDWLCDKFGLERKPDEPTCGSTPSAYFAAMAASLHLVDGHSGIRATGVRGFAIGEDYRTYGWSLGVLALDRGWVPDDEDERVRSDGSPASLAVPLDRDVSRAGLRLLLEAEVVCGPCEIRVATPGTPSKIIREFQPRRRLTIELPVSPSRCDAGPVIWATIECRSLADDGSRRATVAISSFRVESSRAATLAASWGRVILAGAGRALLAKLGSVRVEKTGTGLAARLRRIVELRRPESSLAIGIQDARSDVDLRDVLGAAGLTDCLIVLHEAEAPSGGKAALPGAREIVLPQDDRRSSIEAVTYGGDFAALLASAFRASAPVGLIALSDGGKLPELLEMVAQLIDGPGFSAPDIVVFTDDPGMLCAARYTDEERYARLLHPDVLDRDMLRHGDNTIVVPWHVCMEPDFVYLSFRN